MEKMKSFAFKILSKGFSIQLCPVWSYFSLPEYYFSSSDYLGERSRRKITTKFILYENFFKAIPWYNVKVKFYLWRILTVDNIDIVDSNHVFFLFLKIKILTIMTEIWMINWLINFEYSRCRIFHFSPTAVRIIKRPK